MRLKLRLITFCFFVREMRTEAARAPRIASMKMQLNCIPNKKEISVAFQIVRASRSRLSLWRWLRTCVHKFVYPDEDWRACALQMPQYHISPVRFEDLRKSKANCLKNMLAFSWIVDMLNKFVCGRRKTSGQSNSQRAHIFFLWSNQILLWIDLIFSAFFPVSVPVLYKLPP